MPIEDKSIPFRFFLTFRTLFPSFRLENLTMTLLGPLLGNQWQSSMLEESTPTSSFLNNWRAVSSSCKFSIDSGRPLSSKHSRLEYWQLLQHCRSNKTICSLSFELCLETQSSDCIFWWFCLRSDIYLCLLRLNQICFGIPEPKQLLHP